MVQYTGTKPSGQESPGTEAAVFGCSTKEVLLKSLQSSQKNTSAKVPF